MGVRQAGSRPRPYHRNGKTKMSLLKYLIVTVVVLGTLSWAMACGSSTVVYDDTEHIEAGSSITYDLSEYETCDYAIQSRNDDIEVNGKRANTHEGSTSVRRLTVSNEYSLFAGKTVDIRIECQS